ncbi:MAG: RNA-binding protein [Myxococcales bacterium]|nr:RNA-binding protein [Myxococcales bacterium]
MAKKLFVGGLAWATDEHGLRSAFEQFGEINEAVVVLDRETGRSRGFGFVTFSDDSAAMNAVQEMNGSDLDGRSLTVNEAQERAPRGGGGGGGRGGRGGGRGRDW